MYHNGILVTTCAVFSRSTYMESDRELCEIAFDRSEYSEPIEVWVPSRPQHTTYY